METVKLCDSNMSVQDHLLSQDCVISLKGYMEPWYFVVHYSRIVTLLSKRLLIFCPS